MLWKYYKWYLSLYLTFLQMFLPCLISQSWRRILTNLLHKQHSWQSHFGLSKAHLSLFLSQPVSNSLSVLEHHHHHHLWNISKIFQNSVGLVPVIVDRKVGSQSFLTWRHSLSLSLSEPDKVATQLRGPKSRRWQSGQNLMIHDISFFYLICFKLLAKVKSNPTNPWPWGSLRDTNYC